MTQRLATQGVILLGPQRLQPNLATEVRRLGVEGPFAAVTSGWQEREAEDDELRAHLDRPVTNLMLHQRRDEIFSNDPELFAAHQRLKDRLRELQRLYRYRLDFTIAPVRELLHQEDSRGFLEEEREAALQALQALDEGFLSRVSREREAFEERWHPRRRPVFADHLRELEALLDGTSAVAVAGGDVGALLGLLRFFGLADKIRSMPIFAWSAGAMALGERVVLFHDSPPQGAGNAEVYDYGLGLFPGLIPLPHARRRLRLDDPRRVELLARRFAPATCVPLDEGARVTWSHLGWRAADQTLRLGVGGQLERFPGEDAEAS